MNWNQKIIISVSSVYLAILFGCVPEGQVRAVRMPENAKIKVGIGHLESRDSNFKPFIGANFRDLLMLELAGLHYRALQPDFRVLHPVSKTAKKTESSAKKNNKVMKDQKDKSESNAANGDPTDRLMPAGFEKLAGEIVSRHKNEEPANMMQKSEIRKLARAQDLDFYLQGSIARFYSGDFLNEIPQALVFIKIYDKEGSQHSMIGFRISGRGFDEADFMENVAARVARAFDNSVRANTSVSPIQARESQSNSGEIQLKHQSGRKAGLDPSNTAPEKDTVPDKVESEKYFKSK